MLNIRGITASIETDLKFDRTFISKLKEINKYGNDVKHENTIQFDNGKAIEHFQICYELAAAFLKNIKGITVNDFEKENFFIKENSQNEELNKELTEFIDAVFDDELIDNVPIDLNDENIFELQNLKEQNLNTNINLIAESVLENFNDLSEKLNPMSEEIIEIEQEDKDNFIEEIINCYSDEEINIIDNFNILGYLVIFIYNFPGEVGRVYSKYLNSIGLETDSHQVNSTLYSNRKIFNSHIYKNRTPSWTLQKKFQNMYEEYRDNDL